jgi:hypothetical protein
MTKITSTAVEEIIAPLIWKFGAPIKVFIDKYFNLLATLFTILLIGFTLLAFWLFGNGEM